MSLKNRIRITTLLFLILGGAIIGFMSLRSAITVFKDLENDNARNNMQRTLNALQQEQTNLDILLSDWASWDDTYEYIENLNSDYEEANIAPSAFETLRLNLMIFINKKGKVVKAIYFDLDSLREQDFPEGLLGQILDNRRLIRHDFLNSKVNGIMITSVGPILIASRPILTSLREGPARGALIFGRCMNSDFIAHFGDLTGLDVDAHLLNAAGLPEDVSAAVRSMARGQLISTRVINEYSIAAYSPIDDIDGEPAMIIRTIQPRPIFNYGKTIVGNVIYLLLAIGIAFFILAIVATDRFVLVHLYRLVDGVNEIKNSRNPSDRLIPSNIEEFATLAEAINGMLDALETSEMSRRRALDEMRQILESISDAFMAVNKESRITYLNKTAARIFGDENREILGVDLYSAFPQFRGTEFEDNYELVVERRIGVGFELRFGAVPHEQWFDVQIYPAADGVSVYFRQSTERKRLEQQTKEKLNFIQSIIDTMPVPVYFKDMAGVYRLCNKAALDFHGLKADELIGKKAEDFFSTALVQEIELQERKLLETQKAVSCEAKLRRADGLVRDVIFNIAPYVDVDGKLAGLVCVATDTTAIKETEIALRRSEERFRSLYGKSPVMMQSVDRNGTIIDVNDYWLSSMGYSRDEVIGKKALEFMSVESVHYAVERVFPEFLRSGFCRQVPLQFVKKNGEIVDVLYSAVAERNEFGLIVTSHEVIVDVTERKKTELALRESENKYRLLFENSTTGIFIMTDVFLDCNEESCRIWACSREDIIGHSPVEFSPEFQPDGRTSAEAAAAYIEAARAGTPQVFEWLHRRKDGVLIFTEISLRSIVVNNANVILATMRDTTAAKKASEQIKAQHRLLHNTIESLSHPFYVIDVENHNVVLANSAARKSSPELKTTCHFMTWGRPKSCGHYGEQCTIDLAVKSRRPVVHERTFIESDGQERVYEIHGHPIVDENNKVTHLIEYAFDITERKKAETAIRTSEERYRLLADSMTDLVCVHDIDAALSYVSPSVTEILGYEPEELIGICWYDLIHAEDRKMVKDNCRAVILDGHRQAKCLYRIKKKQGDYIWFETISRPRSDGAGKIVEFQTSSRDVTARVLAEQALRESEEKYRELIETQGEGVGIFDLEERFVFINPAAAEIFGVDRESIKGRSFSEFVSQEQFEEIRRQTQKRLTGVKSSYAIQIRRPDGQVREVMVSGAPSYDKSGKVVATFGLFRDITEQKRAEEALRESEEKMRSIFRVAPTGIGVVQNRVFLEVNEKFCEMTGYSRWELIGQSAKIIYPDEEEYEFVGREKYRQIAESGTGTVETRFKRKDGGIINVILSSTPIDPKDHSRGVTFTALDITERKMAEEALRRSKNELSIRNQIDRAFLTAGENVLYRNLNQIILECLSSKYGLITYIDPDNKFIFPTLGAEILEKYDIPGQSLISADSQLADTWNNILRNKKSMIINQLENPIMGIFKATRALFAPIMHGDELLGAVAVADKETDYNDNDRLLLETIADHIAPILKVRLQRDVFENQRRLMEEALKESEQKYRQVIETSPVTIWSFDAVNNELTVISPAIESLTGYRPDEFRENPEIWKSIIHPDDMPQWLEFKAELLKNKSTMPLGIRIIHKNGSLKTVSMMLSSDIDSTGRVVRIDGIVLDITEKLLLENQIIQSEKMAAIGILAAGVAHEFNNLLGGIMGNLSFGLNYSEDGNLLRSSIKEALKITEQAAELVQSLLSYSRRKNEQVSGVDITTILDDIIKLTGKEIRGKAIHLYKNYEKLPPVKGVPGQLQQVFLNILINAIHAVENGGFISVSAWCAQGNIYVEIADNGCGIKQENLSKIFDPFFTTKGAWGDGQAKGTGLGLSICYNIIKNHGGEIQVVSKENVGSQFTVIIPTAEAIPEIKGKTSLLQGKRVLAHEFDREQAEILVKIFGDFGASCQIISWNEEMPADLGEKRFDLVLLDASHPAMVDFVRTYDAIKSAMPSCPIFITGFGQIKYQYDEYVEKADGIINKPFTAESLYTVISKSIAKVEAGKSA